MIKKYRDVADQLELLKKIGSPKGDSTGFRILDEHFSVKQGSFTFILGAPHSGKSELSFEIALNQLKRHKKKVLVVSPETGAPVDIYAELIHKLSGRSIFSDHGLVISYEDFKKWVAFIDTWFSIVDTEERSFSFGEINEMVTDEQIILKDPYNEFAHDMSKFGSRQDLYIEELIGDERRFNKKKETHTIITLHPAAQNLKEEKIGGQSIRYYPMPLAREASGGQSLLRKAMTWINIWRPPVGLKDARGRPYEKNETVYMMEKAKPKGVATKGVGSLYYDFFRSRFYEKIGENKCYAFQHEKFPKDETEPRDAPF